MWLHLSHQRTRGYCLDRTINGMFITCVPCNHTTIKPVAQSLQVPIVDSRQWGISPPSGLMHWYAIFKSSHCNSFEDRVPVNTRSSNELQWLGKDDRSRWTHTIAVVCDWISRYHAIHEEMYDNNSMIFNAFSMNIKEKLTVNYVCSFWTWNKQM